METARVARLGAARPGSGNTTRAPFIPSFSGIPAAVPADLVATSDADK
jgi:hypothetical protein